MALKTLAVLVLLVVTAAVMMTEAKTVSNLFAHKQCGGNEEWECRSGTCGEPTCQEPVLGRACTKDCLFRCYCRRGLFRNSQGACVTRNECP
ncbi:hypothetical protein HPB50_008645 [Hyalomma asiaticum]|uniref:Uncharacterized protein n=1 Tax=Hyalomma asiaticum TaxID=266040 RepID=A0ACB7T8M1_HYAAI|nr:hypothetical protein HPB50_008645 [Hyalomma asiaticum]